MWESSSLLKRSTRAVHPHRTSTAADHGCKDLLAPKEHVLVHWEQMSRRERKRIEILNRSPFRSLYKAVPITVIDPIYVAKRFFILERVRKFKGSKFSFVPDNNINKVVFAQQLL